MFFKKSSTALYYNGARTCRSIQEGFVLSKAHTLFIQEMALGPTILVFVIYTRPNIHPLMNWLKYPSKASLAVVT